MNKELGVWTYDDCALLLIDYQNEMFETITVDVGAGLATRHYKLVKSDRPEDLVFQSVKNWRANA